MWSEDYEGTFGTPIGRGSKGVGGCKGVRGEGQGGSKGLGGSKGGEGG